MFLGGLYRRIMVEGFRLYMLQVDGNSIWHFTPKHYRAIPLLHLTVHAILGEGSKNYPIGIVICPSERICGTDSYPTWDSLDDDL